MNLGDWIGAAARAGGEPLGLASAFLLWAMSAFLALPLAILAGGRFFAEIAAPVTAIADELSMGAERIAQVLLLAMTCLVGVSVVLRYVFGLSLTAVGEGALYAHALAFLLASPAALGRNGHVRVDVFQARFSPRAKAAVDFAAFHLFLAPMLIALITFAGPFVASAWRIGERSQESDGLPILFLLKTAIPVFAVLLLAQGLAEACRNACRLRGLEPAPGRLASLGDRPA
jgi:TRAP-type mannitol/chloroaromatic compound transport system permease small subunit